GSIQIRTGAPAGQFVFGRIAASFFSVSRSRTTMKCHGCEFRELPVQRASSSSLSITSSGTGSSAYWRICDTRRIGRSAFTRAEHTRTLRCDDAPVKEIDAGELERLGSALGLA